MFRGIVNALQDRVYGDKDPTRLWDAGLAPPPVDVNLDRHALCGVGIGEPVDRLASRLGRAEDIPSAARGGSLKYPSKGLYLSAAEGKLDTFVLAWGDPQAGTFRGTCTYRGRPVNLSGESTESNVVAALGEPYWAANDGPERVLFYEHGPVEWQVVLNPAGRLTSLEVTDTPELADESSREYYGVTKPWPSQG